jgi:cell division septum initiation protein DivIVA
MSVPRSPGEVREVLRDLRGRVEALANRTDDLQARLADLDGGDAVTAPDRDEPGRVEQLEQRVAELEAEVDALRSVESEASSKEEKIAAIVATAENLADPGQRTVTVLVKDVRAATGVSRRYAYDLVDDMVEQYEWASAPPEAAYNEDSRQKGVRVDLEAVHAADGAVNKFTTGVGGEGSR